MNNSTTDEDGMMNKHFKFVKRKKITFDSNCLINLKNKTGQHKEIEKIIDAHKKKRALVFIPAISASEYQKGGIRYSNYKEFRSFLKTIGCGNLSEIFPMGYFGVAFWGHALYSGPKEQELEKRIHNVLFPYVEFRYVNYCKKHSIDPKIKPMDKRWINKKCDVQFLWSHINSSNDIFVTEDKNFFKHTKKSNLEKIGANLICKPKEALKKISS